MGVGDTKAITPRTLTPEKNIMCEDAPCCGCCGPQPLEPELMSEAALELEMHGWPGDGSGEDDLADYNANEVNDYMNE